MQNLLLYFTRNLISTFSLQFRERSLNSYPIFFFFLAVAVNRSGTCGALYVADPLEACSSLQNKGTEQTRLALIIRGGCSFEDKIRNAQNAGFSAAIVYNDQNDGSLVYSESACPL